MIGTSCFIILYVHVNFCTPYLQGGAQTRVRSVFVINLATYVTSLFAPKTVAYRRIIFTVTFLPNIWLH